MSNQTLRDLLLPSSTAGLQLETTIVLPWKDAHSRVIEQEHDFRSPGKATPKLAIFAHPFGRLGGNKEDPYVPDVKQGMLRARVLTRYLRPVLLTAGFTVLSYNARGVGRSEGSASLLGSGEGEDAAALASWVLQRMGVREHDRAHVVFAGYSYGSLAATLALPLLRASFSELNLELLLISPPISIISAMSYLPCAAKRFDSIIKTTIIKRLVIFGDKDQITAVERYQAWTAALQGELFEARQLPGDHFWRSASADEMVKIVRVWLGQI